MKSLNVDEQSKLNKIFIFLTGIFITNAIVAEILGTKIFDISIFKDFSLSVGVLIWPVVFITTDIINEYFGKKGVKRISYFTILLISGLDSVDASLIIKTDTAASKPIICKSIFSKSLKTDCQSL